MALVVKRRPEEVICIGENITVKILEVRGDQVQIAIDAPRDVRVDRQEVRIRKNAEGARDGR